MTPELARRLDHLRHNRVSGALDLAVEAIGIALDAPEAWPEIALQLETMHPAIVTVANVGRLIEDGRAGTRALLTALRRSLGEGNQKITAHLQKLIPPGASILTISNSSTVLAAMAALSPRRVYALESLPGGEGRVFAANLREQGMARAQSGMPGKSRARRSAGDSARSPEVIVLPDAAMGRYVQRADCALVGLDAYDETGSILHKLGTLPLALCCAHFHRPFYAAGHSFKLSPVSTESLLREAGDAASHFDRTPPELITMLITERGPLRRRL